MLVLNQFLSFLQGHYSIDYAFISHHYIAKDFFTVIYKLSLHVKRVIKVEQLFALQFFDYLGLL